MFVPIGTMTAGAAGARPPLILAQAPIQQEQLPAVQVGPAPPAEPPAAIPGQAAPAQTFGSPPRQLQLRVDPQTGEPRAATDIFRQSQGATNGPTPLLRAPSTRAAGTSAAPAAPATDTMAPKTQPLTQAPVDSTGGIRVEQLQAVDRDSIGTLDENEGGFGLQTWAGTTREQVDRLLPLLPADLDLPVMQDLMRRLLLSTAVAPAGEDRGEFFAQRVGRLAAAGRHAEALSLMEQAPVGSTDPALASVRLEALLLLGNISEACSLVRNQIAEAKRPVWQKATAFCLASEGQTSQVDLYQQLLYENGIEDPPFFALLSALIGHGDGIDSLPQPSALHLAMLRAGQWPIPDDAVAGASPSILRAIATAPKVSTAARLDAAEAAAALGLLDAETLRRIYAGTSVPLEGDDKVATASEMPGPLATAGLIQAATAEADEAERARLVQAVLRQARDRDRFLPIAGAVAPLVNSIAPSPQLAWFAADAGRAMMAAGAPERARQWLLATIAPARQRDGNAAQAVLTITPLLYVGDGDGRIPVLADALAGWWRGEVAAERPDRVDRAGLFYNLIEAFDLVVPTELWEEVIEAPDKRVALPAPGVRVGLRRAAEAGRVGETVLLALVALGQAGPAQIADQSIADVVKALRLVGLEREARALATEVMIKRGF